MDASEVGCTRKISWEYNSATTILKWVYSLPVYCAFSQLSLRIKEFICGCEMHRYQSTEQFFLDFWNLATDYNTYSQETDIAWR